ncbi:retrovirus-related pol polyprotein from transposon TNT 1-94 [Tanacetum coccineum]
MMASSPICLLSKASKTKSWLWHRHLSHLNFGSINHLARHGLVRGLPKLKFEKDHLCSACALGKSSKKPHKPKSEDTNQEKLYLLHMDLCGLMRVAYDLRKPSVASEQIMELSLLIHDTDVIYLRGWESLYETSVARSTQAKTSEQELKRSIKRQDVGFEAMHEELMNLNLRGFRQDEGIDFEVVIRSVARLEDYFEFFLAFDDLMNMVIYQLVVKNACLNGLSAREKKVYVMPTGRICGFRQNSNYVYKLKKALYGLKQAPRVWYDMLSSFLISNDFSKGSVDPTLFILLEKQRAYSYGYIPCGEVHSGMRITKGKSLVDSITRIGDPSILTSGFTSSRSMVENGVIELLLWSIRNIICRSINKALGEKKELNFLSTTLGACGVYAGYSETMADDVDESRSVPIQNILDNKDISIADQIALDDALVAPADRLKIGKCNLRLSSDVNKGENHSSGLSDVLKSSFYYGNSKMTSSNLTQVGIKKFVEPPLKKEITHLSSYGNHHMSVLRGTSFSRLELLYEEEQCDVYPRFTNVSRQLVLGFFYGKDPSFTSKKTRFQLALSPEMNMFTTINVISRMKDLSWVSQMHLIRSQRMISRWKSSVEDQADEQAQD